MVLFFLIVQFAALAWYLFFNVRYLASFLPGGTQGMTTLARGVVGI
jgi:hypothetical protein